MIFSLKALDAHMVWVTTIVGTVAIWEGDRGKIYKENGRAWQLLLLPTILHITNWVFASKKHGLQMPL